MPTNLKHTYKSTEDMPDFDSTKHLRGNELSVGDSTKDLSGYVPINFTIFCLELLLQPMNTELQMVVSNLESS